MQRWKLTVEYDGTDFVGWQRQSGGLVSVQGEIEKAIYEFCGEEVTLHVAGRTDAGVHAVGQVCHVDLNKEANAKTVQDAINFHLRGIPACVIKAEAVADEFHARFSAKRRVYCYKFLMARGAAPTIGERHVWHIWRDLNVDAMQEAANHLLGTHDFSSFRAAECQAESPVRSVDRIEFIEKQDSIIPGRHIEMWVEARSFLHHQIRNFAGTLKTVGEEKWQPKDVKRVLEACDRTKAGQTAPASGLFFVRVDYS